MPRMSFTNLGKKVKHVLDDYLYIFFLQVALVIATGIDFIVHEVLYKYGLQFSYEWAMPYWTLLGALFFAFALIGLSAYTLDRKFKCDLEWKKAGLVFGTILGEYFGWFLDTAWFIIRRLYTGQPVDWYQNWWWHPFEWIFGRWNLHYNVIYNLIILIILVILWEIVLRNEKYKLILKSEK